MDNNLLKYGIRAVVRERNNNFWYCSQIASSHLIAPLGSIVSEYCHGLDHVIPETIVDLLFNSIKFTTKNHDVSYDIDWTFGHYCEIVIELHPYYRLRKNLLTYYPNDESCVNFMLTGYDENVYRGTTILFDNVIEYTIHPSDLDILRREMLDVAAQM